MVMMSSSSKLALTVGRIPRVMKSQWSSSNTSVKVMTIVKPYWARARLLTVTQGSSMRAGKKSVTSTIRWYGPAKQH